MFYATYLDVKNLDLEIQLKNYCVNKGYIHLTLNDTDAFVSPTESPDSIIMHFKSIKCVPIHFFFSENYLTMSRSFVSMM